MSFKVIINKSAIKDIAKAIEYYEKQNDGLGNRFKKLVDEYIQAIEINPNYGIRYDNVRCLPIKVFPYMIHYSINNKNKTIRIYAILNTKLNPNIWQKRTK